MQGGCIKSQAIKHHLLLKTGDVWCPPVYLHRLVNAHNMKHCQSKREEGSLLRTQETIPNMRFAGDMGHGMVRIDDVHTRGPVDSFITS